MLCAIGIFYGFIVGGGFIKCLESKTKTMASIGRVPTGESFCRNENRRGIFEILVLN